jgi:putative sterol carrier protein
MGPTPTAQFFAELATRPHDPLLEKANGALRFEFDDDPEGWLVTIDHGDISVTGLTPDAEATCTVRGSRALFDELTEGRANAMAAVLRGELVIEGDTQLVLLFQRVFPGPPGAQHPRTRVSQQ